jgi:hypothetical protein
MVSSDGMHKLHVSLLAGVSNSGYLEVQFFAVDQCTVHSFQFSNGVARSSGIIVHGVDFDWNRLQEYEVAKCCID